jgi:hypothetical protein
MDDSGLKYKYHDSNVEKVELGPRREFNLKIHLDPIINEGKIRLVNLSFRGVDNLEIVKGFVKKYLESKPAHNAFVGRIDDLRKIKKSDYVIDFNKVGQLAIKCKGHVETTDASA